MEENSNQAILERYLYRLMLLKEKTRAQLTTQELQSIANDLGLTQADIAAIAQEAEKYAARGMSFQKAKRWQEAETQFQQAIDIEPLNPHYSHLKANLLFEKWRQKNQLADLLQAEQQTRYSLEIAPAFEPAIELLKNVDQIRKKKARRNRVIGGMAFVLLLLLALPTWLILNEIGTFDLPPTGLEGTSYQVTEIEITNPKELEGIELKFHHFNVSHGEYAYDRKYFNPSYYFTLFSDAFEVKELELQAQYFGDNDTLLATGSDYYLVSSYSDPIRANLYFIEYDSRFSIEYLTSPQKIKRVAFSIKKINRYPAPLEQAVYDTLPQPEWRSLPPKGFQLSLATRQSKLEVLDYDSSYLFQAAWQITNQGPNPCHELTLELRFFKNGKLLLTDEVPVLHREGPPLPASYTTEKRFLQRYYAPDFPYPHQIDSIKVAFLHAE